MNELTKKLTVEQYIEFSRRCCKECNISRATWSNWRRGKNKPEAKYRCIIDRIANEMFGWVIFGEGGER